MASVKTETVRSSSSGTIGRAVSQARDARLVLDSSSRAQPDALTNSEAFLAAIASCGVTLVELHAGEIGVPLTRMTVDIEGVRGDAPRFEGVAMRFELAGVTPAQAEDLVETYKSR